MVQLAFGHTKGLHRFVGGAKELCQPYVRIFHNDTFSGSLEPGMLYLWILAGEVALGHPTSGQNVLTAVQHRHSQNRASSLPLADQGRF